MANQPAVTPVSEKSQIPLEGAEPERKSRNPTKWSWARKVHVVVAGFTCTFNGNLGSSMPSGALAVIAEHFAVTDRVQLILLNSLYMVGYVLGPLLFGPLSEYVGRRPVLIGTFLGYFVFMLACSGAPSYPVLLTFRLLCGVNAAAPTTVISGLYADIFDNPSQRGTALALYMSVTTIGPLIGPIISGFSSLQSWRWPFWAAALIAVPGLPLVLTLPETFAPVLHNNEVRSRMRLGVSNGEEHLTQVHAFNVRKIFLRPVTLMVTEPILLFTSLYLALAYAIFYLMFQAYPIVFQDHYGLSPGMAGLAYIPTIVGVLLSLLIFHLFSRLYDRSARVGKRWAQREVYRRLIVACFASPCMVIALFWLGWTAWDDVSPILPSIGGFFFGIGFQLVFMGMSNYITDVFRQLSASAQAAASCTRSLAAILLPLAADSMYGRLGIHWAPSLLGFLSLAMGVIPFVFIRYGDSLVRKSKVANGMYSLSGSA